MDELVRWLGEQLDDDERIARAAAPGPWRQDPERIDFLVSAEHGYVVDCSGARAAAENAAHVAVHDPARVLREIEAKRGIIRAYETAAAAFNDTGPAMANYDRLTGSVSSLRGSLELLAAVYADRPGFRKEWAP